MLVIENERYELSVHEDLENERDLHEPSTFRPLPSGTCFWARQRERIVQHHEQRACLRGNHSDLLQQLQRIGTEPIFGNFPRRDSKEIHPRKLNAFANRGRRGSWHPTLIDSLKEPATSNVLFIGDRADLCREAVARKGSSERGDPLFDSIRGSPY